MPNPVRLAWLCGDCRGKSMRLWCRSCRATLGARTGRGRNMAPDYVELATLAVERETGRSRATFGMADRMCMTQVLVQWGREREPEGPLKAYGQWARVG